MPIDLHLLRPFWLLALLPLASLLFVLWRGQTGAGAWRGVVDAHLLPHLLAGEDGSPRRTPLILLGIGWTLLVLALAGPVWSRLPQPVFSVAGARVILLDLSPSMNAADLAPSRLARARFEILDLLRATREGQVALLAFGPEPFVVSPLTQDARTIAEQVPNLTTDLIPAPGPRRTDRALDAAGELLAQAGIGAGELILVTDAVGDLAHSLEVTQRLAAAGHRVSVLAVGTPKGAPIPAASGGFAQDTTGGIQVARLDADQLRELARAGRGQYRLAEVGDQDTQALLAGGPSRDTAVESKTLQADQWREEGPWILLLLLPLAAVAFRRGWLVPALLLVLVAPPTPGWAGSWSDLWQRPDQQAARHLAAGQAQAAAERFEDPAWQATARYQAGDFKGALQALSGLAGAETDYNRGNALARLGRLEEAIAAYEQVLSQTPEHADARHNLDLVRQLLEQRKQQPPPESTPDESEGKQERSEDQKDQAQGQQGHDASDDQAGKGQRQEQAGDNQEKGAQGSREGQSKDASSSEPTGDTAGQESDSNQQAGSDQPSSGEEQQETESQQTNASGGGQDSGHPPDASDLMQDRGDGAAAPSASDTGSSEQTSSKSLASAAQTEGNEPPAPDESGSAMDSLTPEAREQQQAMEAQLRRVPDDPGGLLRQRFLLQHLRREGRLP